jgi:hypothetical protein
METSVLVATFFMSVSMIHGNVCCNGHIIYVCIADLWKLSVLVVTFIMYYVCVADPWNFLF